MKQNPLAPKAHVANCTGQQCPERGTCLRYLRPAWRAHKDHESGKVTVQLWASFDIERQRFKDCPAKLPVTQMQRALLQAVA